MLFLVNLSALAQVSTYSFSETTEAYVAVTGTNSTATGDDGIQNGIPIGFTFKYDGVDYTHFCVSTNGWIKMGDAATTGTTGTPNYTNALSTTAGNRPLITPLWDDNNLNAGTIAYSLTGTAPNQILEVGWDAINIGGSGATSTTNTASYKLRLYEGTNVIEFVYGPTMATAGTLSASVGLNGSSTFLSVTPAATSTVSSVTANNTISATTNLAGKKYIFTPPACLAPSGIAASAITTSGATVSWNAVIPAPATGYEYVVSTSNTAPAGAGTATTAASVPVSSLSAGTTYYIFVRSNCGGTFSAWNGPVSFVTACNTVALPWTENFDALTPGTNVFPNCWSYLNTSSTWSISTAPTANSGANSLRRTWGTEGWAFTPLATLTSGTSYTFSYYRRTNDTTVGYDITVGVGTEQTEAAMTTTLSSESGYQGPAWTKFTHEFTPTVTGDYSFGVYVYSDFAPNGINFDDFKIEITPSCIEPSGLSASAVTATTATISWNAATPVPSVGYQYVISTSNTTPVGAGTPVAGLTDNVTSLTPSTVYYLFVRSDCGGTFSSWSPAYSFTTECVSVTAFTQNFDGVTAPNFPSCWARVGTGGGANIQTTNPSSAPNTMYIYGSTGSLGVVKMQQVSNLGAGTHRLRFRMRGNFTAGDAVEVGYLTDPLDDATFVSLTSFTASTLTYQDFSYAPTAGSYSDYIAFRHAGNSGLSILIDDVAWEPIPAVVPGCVAVTSPANGAVNVTSSMVTWSSNVDATGYKIKVGTTLAGSEFLALTDVLNVTSYNLGALAAGTTYYVTVIAYNPTGDAIGCTTSSFTTCGATTVLPWTENFDALATVGTNSFPGCWTEENGDWESSNATTRNTPRSGANYIRDAWSATDEYMWTPAFNLTAGVSYDFSAYVQGDNGESWAVDMYYNTTANSAGATVLGTSYSPAGTGGSTGPYTPQSYVEMRRTFVPSATGTYYFGVNVNEQTGDPYYIALDDFRVELTPSCAAPSPSASGVTSSAASISWTPTTGNYEYVLDQIATDPAGAGTVLATESYNPATLLASTTYYFHVRTVCAGPTYSTWSTISFTTLATPPVNDDCAGAIALTPAADFATGAITGTLVGASDSEDVDPTIPSPGCASYIGHDVWFSVVVPASGSITFETGNAPSSAVTDPGMAIYTGSCGALTLADCDDSSSSNPGDHALITLDGTTTPAVTAGETLYARVWRYNSISASRDIAAVGEFRIAAWDTSLSTNSFNLVGLKTYPNPVKDIFKVSYTKNISNVSVTNLLGQEVLTQKVNALQTEVNMAALQAGTYLVKVTSEGLTKTIKVIKE